MKIIVDVDITPEELRKFLGLPNIEGLQEEMLKAAQKRLTESAESGQAIISDLVAGAIQPMQAYQQWLQRVLTGSSDSKAPAEKEQQ